MITELCEMTNTLFRGVRHMTEELLKDRLEMFKKNLRVYREIRNKHTRSSSEARELLECSELAAHKDKLRQEFDYLDESVTRLSRGRYRIHVDSNGCHDVYAGMFYEDSPPWYLDAVLDDLDSILEELMVDSRCDQETPGSSNNRSMDVNHPATAFGALGHQGHSQVPYSHELRPAYTPNPAHVE
jgi:hypothetical protein